MASPERSAAHEESTRRARRSAASSITHAINWALLWAFLVAVYVVPYETRFVRGTLPSWLLFVGFLIVAPQVAAKCIRSGGRLPRDYAILLLLFITLMLGFVVNLRTAQMLTLQAYLLSLAGYLVVRETMPTISLKHFYTFNALFLLSNSALMIAQFLTGRFFPAGYLTRLPTRYGIPAGDVVFYLPSGFADGPIKNGMIHSAALSLVLARSIFLPVRLLSINTLALLLGVSTLLITVSRAGVVGAAAAAVLNIALAIFWRRKFGLPARRLRRGFSIVALGAVALFFGAIYSISGTEQTAAQEAAGATAGKRAVAVVQQKFVPKGGEVDTLIDASIEQRFTTYKTALYVLSHNPFGIILGTGMGTFVLAYQTIGPKMQRTYGEYDFNDSSAESSWLEFLIEGGLVAFCVWLYLVFHIVGKALARPDAVFSLPVLSALVCTMVFMMTHDVLRGRVFWIPLAVLAAVAYGTADLRGMVDRGRRFG